MVAHSPYHSLLLLLRLQFCVCIFSTYDCVHVDIPGYTSFVYVGVPWSMCLPFQWTCSPTLISTRGASGRVAAVQAEETASLSSSFSGERFHLMCNLFFHVAIQTRSVLLLESA